MPVLPGRTGQQRLIAANAKPQATPGGKHHRLIQAFRQNHVAALAQHQGPFATLKQRLNHPSLGTRHAQSISDAGHPEGIGHRPERKEL